MVYEGFVGETYVGQSLAADGERCVNLFPEINGKHGKSSLVLVGRPGLQNYVRLPTQPVRGLWAGENRLFAAGGSRFYEVFADQTVTDLGNIGDDAKHSPVQVFSNAKTSLESGTALFIVSAGRGYLADGVTITPLTLADGTPLTAQTGAYLDGYFLAQRPNSNQVNYSALNDGTTWLNLAFFTKQGAPDDLSAIYANAELLYPLGEKTAEVWRDTGNPPPAAPFTRMPSVFIEAGLVAPFSVAKVGNSLMWLEGNERGAGKVILLDGWSPTRVSTHSVEIAIKKYAETGKITDATAYTYEDDGHVFYVLSFPTADATWVFDATTKMWSEWTWLNQGVERAFLGRCHAYTTLGGGPAKHFVGDYQSGKIYWMSMSLLDDDGAPIRRRRRAPVLSSEDKPVFYKRMRLDVQAAGEFTLRDGNGNARPPQFELTISNDGGFTWSNEKRAYAGKQGEYSAVVQWTQLGGSMRRVFDVTSSDPIQHVWVNAYLDLAG